MRLIVLSKTHAPRARPPGGAPFAQACASYFCQTFDVIFKVVPQSHGSRQGRTDPSFTMSRPPAAMARRGNSVVPLIASRRCGGARRVRTDDLMLAKHALYQLSYGPSCAPAALRRAGPPRGGVNIGLAWPGGPRFPSPKGVEGGRPGQI